jgi:hypothetical protein
VLLAVIALVSSACSSGLGRTMPECERGSATLVLAVQSVPGSHYVSCVEGLKAGWTYEDLKAESGLSSYVLDSDRMGRGFLRVDNVLSCDPGEAELVATLEPDVELWKAVAADVDVDIVVIPEVLTPETMLTTAGVVVRLNELEIRDQGVDASASLAEEPVADRIEDASAHGDHVIVISVRDAEEGTLTLLLRGSDREVDVDGFDAALELIEEAESEPSYVGHWFYVFEGGCVVYTFDARGPGVTSIEEDIDVALSLYDAEELRQEARDAGYRIP